MDKPLPACCLLPLLAVIAGVMWLINWFGRFVLEPDYVRVKKGK